MCRRSNGAFTTNADTAEAPHTASTISPLTGRLPATPGRPPEAPGRPPVASGRPGRLPGVSGAGGPAEASPAATTLADLDQAVPAQLEWVGAIADVTAQRIAGDADIWRIILDPATSQPLNVGRAHRLVPAWLRKALHARDRGCRFPGCHPPVAWTDAHHLQPWAHGGATYLDNLILLCRHHHGLVHEGRWRIAIDAGAVTATRPDGRPYELNQPRAPGHAA